jgi:hypothetical protein
MAMMVIKDRRGQLGRRDLQDRQVLRAVCRLIAPKRLTLR